MVAGCLTGCGSNEAESTTEGTSAAVEDTEEASSESAEVEDEPWSGTLTVWSPQEDQDTGWLSAQCDAFNEAHPNWDITFEYGVCAEGDAKSTVTQDVEGSADVYMLANDNIPDLVGANALAELGGSYLDYVTSTNSESIAASVTYNDAVVAFPFTSNTWFMYYDKSVFSDEDIKSLDAMLQKGKVAFPLDNSWYIAAFYVANGCTLFGENGGDADAGFDFSGDKAVAVTNYLVDLIANPNFSNGDVGTNADAKAFFSGTWDYQKAVDAYGDNLGIAAPPSINIGGEMKQMKSFAGSKAIGVNPATALYKEHPEIAVALAAYLGGTDAQKAHYELRNIIPTDNNISVDDISFSKSLIAYFVACSKILQHIPIV